MKLNTVMPYLQTATRVSFVATQDETGQIIREYFDNGTLSLRFIADSRNNATVYCNVDLPLFEKLRNVKDTGGRFLFAEGDWLVKQKSPVLNALGYLDGYAYQVFLQDGS